MKFGKQLQFIAVKEWFDKYIPYNDYKKLIKQLQFRLQETREMASTEEEVENVIDKCVDDFLNKVNDSISNATSFYLEEYLEVQSQIESIKMDLNEAIENENCTEEVEKNLRNKVFTQMLTVYELRTFLEVNKTGGQKIVKKFAKQLKLPYVTDQYAETEVELFGNLPIIRHLVRELEDLYVTVVREISPSKTKESRPDIILQLHTQVENSLMWKQSTFIAKFDAVTFRHNELLLKPAPLKVTPIVISLVLLIACQIKQFSKGFDMKAQRCLGIVAFCSVMWATSAVPLWLTSFCVPFLGVVCKVLPYSAETVGKIIEQSTMSPTVYLTIGGFTIAAALRETEMDKRLATVVLRKASSNRRIFLLVLIILNAFIAMWISNITSTMIVVTLVGPTLQQIPTETKYAKAVVFAIAVGGNLGGMMTPLSSPQNAVTVESVAAAALEYGVDAEISFVEFFATALPFSLFCCFISWLILMLRFKMDIDEVPPVPPAKTDFGWRQIFVSVVSVGTIAVWISLPFGGDKVFSDFGIVGFIPVMLFYGSTILPPVRLADLPWNIIFLLLGGNALCKVVTESGLMQVASDLMTSLLGNQGLWVSILVVNLCVIFIDFFLTHTVSSMITLPLVCRFSALSGHLELYAMSTCMTTTASQILPVSSFPNMCCSSLQDDGGKNYITSKEMIVWGIMVTIACVVSVMSVYYGIGLLYGM